MIIPSEFARAAVCHGTVATVSDPHEIANVLGIEGIRFMINNGKKVNFKFFFGAPSCVPATDFETSGGRIGLEETEELLKMDDIHYLSEMMNFPGVLNDDETVMAKIALAIKYGKVIDGHAPGLKGNDAAKYIKAGISTDHECFSIEEARDKIKAGMKILIREGSAAKNFNELIPLIKEYPDSIMLCSDDKHPDDLIKSHINNLVKRAIDKGYDVIDVLRSCTYNPVKHYNLNVGLLQKGDPADFILIDNLKDFNVSATFINGQKVSENNVSLIKQVIEQPINNFNCNKISAKDIEVEAKSEYIKVIVATDGQLVTEAITVKAKIADGRIISDTDNDILKLIVYNRYSVSQPAIGFIKNFGIKQGAIASSIAHDSHNIIAVGVSDDDIVNAINLIITNKGGITYAHNTEKNILKLPIAGIMSNENILSVVKSYEKLSENLNQSSNHQIIKSSNKYMTLAFMALLVIPDIKLSDKGLFDVNKFRLISLS
jgi:adenine deaminase